MTEGEKPPRRLVMDEHETANMNKVFAELELEFLYNADTEYVYERGGQLYVLSFFEVLDVCGPEIANLPLEITRDLFKDMHIDNFGMTDDEKNEARQRGQETLQRMRQMKAAQVALKQSGVSLEK